MSRQDARRRRQAAFSFVSAIPVIAAIVLFVLAFSADPDTAAVGGRLALRSLYLILAAVSVCLTVLSALLIVYLSERSRSRTDMVGDDGTNDRTDSPVASGGRSHAETDVADRMRGRATILQSRDTGLYLNEEPRLSLELEVRLGGRAPYTVEKQVVVPPSRLPQVQAGSEVDVLVDASDPTDPDRISLLLS